MSYRRIAAVVAVALLLSGCGSTTGAAPAAPKAAASKTGPQAAGKAAPRTAQTGGSGHAAAGAPRTMQLHAPKEVSLADNGAIVDLRVGDAFALRLPAPKGWNWQVKSFGAVLAKSPGTAGALADFRATKAGFTELTAEEVPPCGAACPHHATGPLFQVAVRVAA